MKAILFDLDGTLLDRNSSLQKFVAGQYEKFYPYLRGSSKENYLKRFMELDASGAVWKNIVYQTIILELRTTEITWQELLEDYENNFHTCCVAYLEMQATLKRLKNKGYLLGIITNGKYPFQQKNIDALGISDYFSTILISEKEGLRKPDPAIFNKALANMGITAGEAIYIGDNPVNDIAGAQSIGMKAIWKNNDTDSSSWESTADAAFRDFSEFMPIIKSLEKSR